MTIIKGENISHLMKDKEGDLYIPREWIKALILIQKANGSEFVGRLRRNEKRYNINYLPDHLPIAEIYHGRSTDNEIIQGSEPNDKMSYYTTTLDFHTHPKDSSPSEQDCNSFIGTRISMGKTYHLVVSDDKATLTDLSNIKRDNIEECKNKDNICECLKTIGAEEHILDGTQDIILKRAFKRKE